ncbi:MAG: TrkH family potassium uptake protein [Paludibacteraceae bacterium]|nr:TrkH family potassium uptake protein [Paludibacteraceae bacterium]MBR4704730.1 TrkH family potassium uptake protein [Paludibacteraceae bacterium]
MTRLFNWRIVFKTMGVLTTLEALFMLIPTFTAWWYHEPDFGAWIVSSAITWVSSWWMVGAGRQAEKRVGEREGYVIVATVWVVYSLFGMLPFWLSGALPSITDAWYETMAGFTTTGSTVFTDVAAQSHSILLWRSLMQWIGGMGIIVLSVAILPMFGLGGMQLYSAEVTGVSYEKLSPRIADTAKHMWVTYILLTVSEGVLLWLFGMGGFDAVCHSMSTISTGGFATHNDSVIAYTPAIQWIIMVYMLLSGINFTQLIYAFRGKPLRLIQDEETRWYICACLAGGIILAVGLLIYTGMWSSIRIGLFTSIATITSTGFVAADYMIWPSVLWVLVFFLMFTGGASGSTAGGMKWVRLAIFAKSAVAEIKRRIHPNAVIPVRFNGHTLREQTTSNIMAFMFFYILIIVLATIVFCGCGVGFDESLGIAVSMIGNVGVSIGQWGSSGCYAALPAVAKWTATFVMLIGRLEIFTVLLLFSRSLWKK